jgi:flagellar basal-body rod modification protein FlgD
MADVAPTAGISVADAQAKVANSGTKLAKDMNSFLLLLTSQLKNQDPLSPMDSTQFTNQLTQFAQVEQQININQNLTSLLAATTQNIVSNAVNYIGNTVEGASDQVPMQNGKFKAGYGLQSDAKAVTVLIKNADGDVVYSKAGETEKGVHPLDWDGKDQYGVQQPDGTYTVTVTALAGDDKPVETYVTAFGRVTGVTTIDNKTVLLMDKVGIPIDSVLSVSETTS